MKKKISSKEKLRREIQSQITKRGWFCVGNYENNCKIGWKY